MEGELFLLYSLSHISSNYVILFLQVNIFILDVMLYINHQHKELQFYVHVRTILCFNKII